MPTLRFHEAARDGILKILLEASEKDCNTPDSDGMTPVHWAAFCGHLPALRLLIGMGGKPGKSDSSGNTALHHAAAGGHLKVVAFLVSIGENPWDLNAQLHSPKIVAGRLGYEDVLRYLDAVMDREMAFNRRKSVRRQQRAQKRAAERFPAAPAPGTSRAGAGEAFPPSGRSEEEGSRGRQLWAMLRNAKAPVYRRMLRRRKQQGDVVAQGKPILQRGESAEPRLEQRDFESSPTLAEMEPRVSVSQPDMLSMSDVGRSVSSDEEEDIHSIFERPGFGKVVFRQNSVILPASSKTLFSKLQRDLKKRSHSIGDIGDGVSAQSDDELSGLDVFLFAWGLVKEGPVLQRAGFTLESLMEAREEDLRMAGIPMGPRKKLMSAIYKRRAVIEAPSPSISTSRL